MCWYHQLVDFVKIPLTVQQCREAAAQCTRAKNIYGCVCWTGMYGQACHQALICRGGVEFSADFIYLGGGDGIETAAYTSHEWSLFAWIYMIKQHTEAYYGLFLAILQRGSNSLYPRSGILEVRHSFQMPLPTYSATSPGFVATALLAVRLKMGSYTFLLPYIIRWCVSGSKKRLR